MTDLADYYAEKRREAEGFARGWALGVRLSRTILPAGSAWPFPDGPVKPRRVKHGPPADAEDAPL